MRFTSLWLSLVCIITFLFQYIIGTELFILKRSLLLFEPWRLITSLFAHGSFAHLLSNLFALALFGLILEGRIGPKRVLLLFIIAGILINVVTPYNRSLGASGAIYAILGCLIFLRPKMMVWAFGIPMPMFIAGIIWLLIDIFGIFVPSNVGNIAHISGLFLGGMYGFTLRKRFGDVYHGKKKDDQLDKALDTWEKEKGLR